MHRRRRSIASALAISLVAVHAAGADPTAKQHRLVERSFHPLLDVGSNQGPPAIQMIADGQLFAYIGTSGGVPCKSHVNRDAGVKVVDLTDPDAPQMTGAIPSPAGTYVKAEAITTLSLDGEPRDVLVIALQPCGVTFDLPSQIFGPPVSDIPTPWTGFEVYDITDPIQPTRLGGWASGGRGIHNLSVFSSPHLAGRTFVAAAYWEAPQETAVPSAVKRSFLGQADSSWEDGALKLVEITDPTTPRHVGTWELEDADAPCFPQGRARHSCLLHDVHVSANGREAYLAFWDAGAIVLDISDPTAPSMIGQWFSSEAVANAGNIDRDEGAVHSVVPIEIEGRSLILVTEEQFEADGADVNGSLRVVDATDPDPTQWQQIAQYDTPNVGQSGWFYAHQPVLGPSMPGGDDIYLSAWGDGVRVLDIADGGASIHEVAWFVSSPDDHADDNDNETAALGGFPDNAGIWGATAVVHPTSGDLLILASDVNRGLYVLERVDAEETSG